MTATLRAAIYARVSSAAQREAHTIENQLRVLSAYVAQQGWTLVDTYVDDGRSAKAGKLDARDGFARLRRDAGARRFDVVVVVDIDRLTRTDDMRERAEILGPFQRAGIRIVTPSGGELDLRTMLGELYVTMQALVAAEENRKRAERVKAGKLRAIAEGRKPAGPTPYGLKYDRRTAQWALDVERAEVVREIFRRVIAGEACLEIARDLHGRDVPPPRGPWSSAKVWHIVRSRHPVGDWVADKRKRLAIAVPAIVDEATWQAAQAALIAHGKRGLRKTKHVYLLEGLAVCARCGSPIAIRSATRNTRRTNGNPSPAAYVCRARKLERFGESRCTAPILPIADVDARVWAKVAAALVSEDLAAALTREASARAENRRAWADDIAGYRRRLTRLAEIEAGTLARHRRGVISDAALDIELPALHRERAAVQVQLATAERAAHAESRDGVTSLETRLAALREFGTVATAEDRQRVVRALVRNGGAVADGESVRITLSIEEASESRGATVLALVPG